MGDALMKSGDNALAAMLLVLSLERPSCNALDAFVATIFEVTFFAINPSFLSLDCNMFQVAIIFAFELEI